MLEDEEGEEFLDGSGSAWENDEGVGVFDHDFHAGVDVITKPEARESSGKAFELDDVGDIGARSPPFGVD